MRQGMQTIVVRWRKTEGLVQRQGGLCAETYQVLIVLLGYYLLVQAEASSTLEDVCVSSKITPDSGTNWPGSLAREQGITEAAQNNWVKSSPARKRKYFIYRTTAQGLRNSMRRHKGRRPNYHEKRGEAVIGYEYVQASYEYIILCTIKARE